MLWTPLFIKWNDEKSGQDKYSTEVVLQGYNYSFTILSGKNPSSTNLQDESKNALPNENPSSTDDLDDEIPF